MTDPGGGTAGTPKEGGPRAVNALGMCSICDRPRRLWLILFLVDDYATWLCPPCIDSLIPATWRFCEVGGRSGS